MPTTPELSRPYAVERLPAEGARFEIEASEGERRALAQRFDLAALDRLEAAGTVTPVRGGAGGDLVEVEGRLRADLSQRCVVTSDPVPAVVEAGFRRVFTREPPADDAGEVDLDPEAEQPEPLLGDAVDAGEVVAEELAVALDPYPRSPGADAAMAALAPPPAGEDEARRPLAEALASLRRH